MAKIAAIKNVLSPILRLKSSLERRTLRAERDHFYSVKVLSVLFSLRHSSTKVAHFGRESFARHTASRARVKVALSSSKRESLSLSLSLSRFKRKFSLSLSAVLTSAREKQRRKRRRKVSDVGFSPRKVKAF